MADGGTKERERSYWCTAKISKRATKVCLVGYLLHLGIMKNRSLKSCSQVPKTWIEFYYRSYSTISRWWVQYCGRI